MGWCIRLSLALFLGVLLSLGANAQEIKYSMGPKCNGAKVVCGTNEVPVCLVFSLNENNIENIKYIPSCDVKPKCIVENSGLPAPDNVQLDCVEFVQCQNDIAHCSDGKIAKCLGNDNELNGCNCKDGSDPICDYTWEISDVGSNLH